MKNKKLSTVPTGFSTYWTTNVRKMNIHLRNTKNLFFRQKHNAKLNFSKNIKDLAHNDDYSNFLIENESKNQVLFLLDQTKTCLN